SAGRPARACRLRPGRDRRICRGRRCLGRAAGEAGAGDRGEGPAADQCRVPGGCRAAQGGGGRSSVERRTMRNLEVRIRRTPATAGDFEVVPGEVPRLTNGGILCRARWLAVDPFTCVPDG